MQYLDDTAALLTSQMYDSVGEWEVILVYATKAYIGCGDKRLSFLNSAIDLGKISASLSGPLVQ